MPAVRTEALVLRKFEYGETSQVLHLLTRDRGRVQGEGRRERERRVEEGAPVAGEEDRADPPVRVPRMLVINFLIIVCI